MDFCINSEIGLLKGVIVHTPGREVSLVNPEFKDELLFDDIVFEEDARREHRDMLAIFKAAMPEDGQLYQITDLVVEAFWNEEARADFIEHMIKRIPEANLHTVEDELLALDAQELLKLTIEGTTPQIKGFSLPPTPNLLFTRDLAAVVGDTILMSRAAKTARIREFLLMEALVAYHPHFETVKERAVSISYQETIEGGDVLVASGDLVIMGMSERTSFSGLMSAAEGLLEYGVTHILAVDIPKKRASMHLDTIFTFSDKDECLVFPPAITERTENVVHLTSNDGSINARTLPSLKKGIEELMGYPFTFINCGGDDRTNQFREQWTDGANVFALAPGVIVGYERNTNTFRALEKHGYRIMNQFDFVSEYKDKEIETGSKIAVSFSGHELCRGRGGARCMTLPVARKDF